MNNGSIRVSLIICAAILLIAGIYFASSVFAPLTFALLTLALVWPLQEALEERLPKFVALFVTLTVTVIVVLAFASILAWALSGIADWLIRNVQRFQTIYTQVTDWLEEHGIFVAGVISERFDVAWLIRMFQEVALRINRLSGFAILAFVFLMMLLLEVKEFSRKIGSLKGAGPKLVEAGSETAQLIRRYMLVRTLLSLITGLAVWGFALLMGVEPASAWGLLAFTLNYIPFLGSFVATLLPGLFALAQLDTWSAILVVIVGLAFIQFLLGNYVEPLVAGAALSISPFAVVFAVFFWGYLWGIPGAFIGVPIMIAVIAVCSKFAGSRWVSTLLSGVPPDLLKRR
ncbi:MAG: AI-2E family transporter [Alphaproteobacteria bacterium]|nr:AI-2E family transporter [Alphaproteobacteria bacterium]